jgi:hypothetical protein
LSASVFLMAESGGRNRLFGRVTARELLILAAGIAFTLYIQLVWLDAVYLIHRHFWLDELFTFRIVSDPDFMHALRGVQSGADGAPPVLHLMLRAFTYVTGGASEAPFRLFSLAAVMGGLAGLYIGLRQDFGIVPSVAALLAVWAHPLITNIAFDARFYGPWLALVVWFAYFFRQALRDQGNSLTYPLLGVTAVLLCTIHYFGIITLALVACTEWIVSRPKWVVTRRALYATAFGPLALLVCVVLFLIGQRSALTAPTWIELAAPGDLLEFVKSVLFPNHLGAVLIAAAAWAALAGRFASGKAPDVLEAAPNPAWGIFGVLLLVPALIVVSYVIQPAADERYAVPAIAALAPATAFAIARMHWSWGVGLCAFLVLVSGSHLRAEARRSAMIDEDTDGLIQLLRTKTADNDVPIIFESNHETFVIARYAPELATRSFYLDYEPDQLRVNKAIRLHDRDMARIYARVYGQPRLINWEAVRALPRVLLVNGIVYGNRISYEPFVEHEINPRVSELMNPRYAAAGIADSALLSASRGMDADGPAF